MDRRDAGHVILVDVGNTNTVFGIDHDGELSEGFRLSTDRERTADTHANPSRAHDPGFAARLTVGRYWKPCQRLELRGSYQGWSSDARQTGRFGFSNVAGGAVIPSPTSMATLENEAHLWSVEFNWWRTSPRLRVRSALPVLTTTSTPSSSELSTL